MALIPIDLFYRRIDGVAEDGVAITRGDVVVSPYYRQDTDSGELTTMPRTFPVNTQQQLRSGDYTFTLVVPNGDGFGGDFVQSSVRTVPTSLPVGFTSLQVDDLTEVNPTPSNTPPPDGWQAYVDDRFDELEALILAIPGGTPIGTGPGGAFIAQDVTDTSAVGRAVMVAGGVGSTASQQAAARDAILAAPRVDPVFTGTTDLVNLDVSGTATFANGSIAQADISGLVDALAARGLASGGTFTNPTFTGTLTIEDGDIAQADVNGLVAALAALDGRLDLLEALVFSSQSFRVVVPVSGAFPARFVGPERALLLSSSVLPTWGGTTSSGTAYVTDYDFFFQVLP